jgi:hypothetical protein
MIAHHKQTNRPALEKQWTQKLCILRPSGSAVSEFLIEPVFDTQAGDWGEVGGVACE